MGVAGIRGSYSLATLRLARSGTLEQRQRWLPALATGKRRSGIALTEPQAGSDLQGIATVARRDGDHYVVNGAKTWITNARHADPLPVLVKTDPSAQPRHRGMSVLMIEQGTPGFTVGNDLDKLGYKGPESSEVCIKASLEAMRIHGGYGYSTEYEIERFYRDAPLMAIGEGTNDILRTVIARQLVREDVP